MSKRLKCEVGTDLGCNGQVIRYLSGTRRGDPKFWCCIGCRAVLNRMGVKTKEIPKEAHK